MTYRGPTPTANKKGPPKEGLLFETYGLGLEREIHAQVETAAGHVI